jgi:alcohol dehydrogenase class IV
MRLILHSRSTKKFIDEWKYNKAIEVMSSPDHMTLQEKASLETVLAIGGGSVIDTAKILSKNPVIAIPTTFSGASRTTHAVYWNHGRKCNYHCPKPITIAKPEYLIGLPTDFVEYSRIDAICHAIESLISKKRTTFSDFCANTALDLLRKNTLEDNLSGSFLAGDAMEMTGTNVIHALSYPLTSLYNIGHGQALAYLLPKVLPYYFDKPPIKTDLTVTLNIDKERVINEALTYPKIFDTRKQINVAILRKLLNEN